MKPNDKAIEAALLAAKTVLRNNEITIDSAIFAAVTAAYAAQFQSTDYAGLVDRLRSQNELYVEKCVGTHDVDENKIEPLCNEAADVIEALLAERDELKGVIQSYQILLETQQGMFVAVQTERDALLVRLAPVDDEALVEIAAKAQWEHAWQDTGGTEEDAIIISGNDWHQFINSARATIAAIRPHIEAAERERCAKIADEMIYADEIAEEIRSKK